MFSSQYYNCRFLAVNDSTRAGAYVTNRIEDCYVEGSIGFGETNREVIIDNNEIDGNTTGSGFQSTVIRNNIIGGSIRLSGGDAIVENCTIGKLFSHSNGEYLRMINSRILNSENNFECVDIANFDDNENCNVQVERCLIKGSINLLRNNRTLIRNNTIIADTLDSPNVMLKIRYYSDIFEFKNNIILCLSDSAALFRFSIPPEQMDFTFQYNCIYEFENIFYPQGRNENYHFDLEGNNNIQADPLIMSPEEPYLLWRSPCIDAGDPNDERDPDGSRVDIGAFWYNHEVSVRNERSSLLDEVELLSLYPNPFNSHLNIEYNLSKPGWVNLRLIDLSGRELLRDGTLYSAPGRQSFLLDGTGLPSGSYMISVQTNREVVSRRISLIK